IADFQSLGGFEELIRPMLGWALEKCRREGIHMVEQAGGWLDALAVPGTAPPHRRKLKSWMFYYRALSKDLSRQLLHERIWSPTSFDGDASLGPLPLVAAFTSCPILPKVETEPRPSQGAAAMNELIGEEAERLRNVGFHVGTLHHRVEETMIEQEFAALEALGKFLPDGLLD